MRQTWVQYLGATLGAQAGHYPTRMSSGVVRKTLLDGWMVGRMDVEDSSNNIK